MGSYAKQVTFVDVPGADHLMFRSPKSGPRAHIVHNVSTQTISDRLDKQSGQATHLKKVKSPIGVYGLNADLRPINRPPAPMVPRTGHRSPKTAPGAQTVSIGSQYGVPL
jgi:hypothetical protein